MTPQHPTTWRRRLAVCNGCDACGSSCVDGVPMSYAEYKRARAYLSSLPADERNRVLSQNKLLPWPGAPQVTYTACLFRDTEMGGCLIYPVRPLICKLFGLVEWLPCPLDRTGPPAPTGVRLIQRYSEQELRPYTQWEEMDCAVGS